MAIGVSSDLANLAIALRIIYPQTTPEGQAFLTLAQERLLAYAETGKAHGVRLAGARKCAA